jgi:haloalkane dehalogenase
MEVVRTPDHRFDNLPEWPYAPVYTEVRATHDDPTSLRIAHVDVGPRDATHTVLLMHGEPSWSYLYRKMIPVLVAAGHRVIAPDLIGFGRSDKPTQMGDYTYERHVDWMSQWLAQHNDLQNMTFFGQDWGGLVGLRVVTAFPDRFSRIVVANTGLPTGDNPPTEAFLKWQQYSQTSSNWNIGKMVEAACATKPLDPAVVAAYDAPFPNDEYTAGSRIFPSLVPTNPTDPTAEANRAAWEVLKTWTKPLVTMFSDSDPVTAGGFKPFQKLVPGAQNQPHITIEGAGHFLQEDKGAQIAHLMNEFMAS